MASLAVIIGGAAINAIAFSGSNYLFSKLSDHGEAECKRHDLAMEDFQKARDQWNKERLKRLDFINKRLRDQQHAKEAITNLEDGMREYYRVFGRKIKPLPKEPVLTDFYHPSEDQKRGEIAFIIGRNNSYILSSMEIPIINGRAE